MPRTRLFRARADRAIGLARRILAAASIAALFLDPVLSRSGSNFTFGIGSAYLALAAIALAVGRWLGYPRLYGLTGRARQRTCLISVSKWEANMAEVRNVFGEPLAECCTKPMTGFYRDGSCNTGPEDFGMHTVCTRVDAAFLAFSHAAGNDLSTPVPEFGFPGLKPGDCWCLCAERWKEAFEAGKAPKVRLTATHETTLEVVPLEVLKRYAIDLS